MDLMASKIKTLIFKNNTGSNSGIVHSKEILIPNDHSNQTIPETQIQTLYQIPFSIKTHEETIFVQEEFHSIPLLSKVSLKEIYLRKDIDTFILDLFKLLSNLLFIQVLMRLFISLLEIINLRDTQYLFYLVMTQINICNGPIYFNCTLNYYVDLTDPLVHESLILDVQVQGNEF